MSQARFVILAVVAAAGAVGVGWAAGRLRPAPAPVQPAVAVPSPPAANRGEVLFGVYCASCHGPEGRGDGPSSAALRPPPRDFAARPWRFAVTRESIRKVTLDGIPGTAMPAARNALAPADADAVADYVFSLATSRPAAPYEPTEEEAVLRAAGFTDLRGTAPPQLVVADTAGKEVKLSDLKGRTVLVHFWATTCVHCVKELPHLKELEAKLADRKLTVLHVCSDADELNEAQALADKVAPGLRIYADATGLGPQRFEVQALPAVWLVAPDGRAVGRATGMRDWAAPAVRRVLERGW
jgi:mono/diheme cytochrome c family protein